VSRSSNGDKIAISIMKTRFPLAFFIACTGLLPVNHSQAAVLADYRFAAFTNAATNVAAGATAGPITNGGGLTFRDSGGNFAPSGAQSRGLTGDGANPQVSHSAAEALTNNDFISFTFNPGAGNQLSVTGFSFWANVATSTEISSNFRVQMINGGTTTLLSTGDDALDNITKVVLGAGSGTGDGQQFNFNLSGLTGLTGTTTFRILFYDTDMAMTNWSGNWLRIDDITLSGDISPIPEPAAVLLGFLGAGFLLRRRRR
jgi:hypothetical protein